MKQQIPNGLIHEKSPYLQQHAYNPVNWQPWSTGVFEQAKRENKPVFLSIGYSTCHWCHVMEQESFEDEEIAELFNCSFLCIKVDREERPDIDAVYMAVCQAMTGQGGWPLSVFLTPDQYPFLAATYLPKHTRSGVTGLIELLPKISHLWQTQPEMLKTRSREINEHLKKQNQPTGSPKNPDLELLTQGVNQIIQGYDRSNGGFHPAPKFPSPHILLFLLRYSVINQDDTILAMVKKTLDQMYRGGIFDHIGGGFSRYSTDPQWLVPHFEKMLNDNAFLSYVYLEAFHITKLPAYRYVAVRTLDYVLAEMRDEGGGFYCSQDADSDGVEGKYYVFTPAELQELFPGADGAEISRWFDITEKSHFAGSSIPNLLSNADYRRPPDHLADRLKQLDQYRKQRTSLHKDQKIMTGWNGLMLAALAKAYQILKDQKYLDAATACADFIARYLTDEDGYLKLRWCAGESAGSGFLDDYAFYSWGLLELYRSTFQTEYLTLAISTVDLAETLFLDPDNGGYYLSSLNNEALISRPKELYDGAMPSGNSVMAMVLTSLAELTGELKWEQSAHRQTAFLAGSMNGYPSAHAAALLAMLPVIYPSTQLVCTAEHLNSLAEFTDYLQQHYQPNLSVLVKTVVNQGELAQIAPFTKDYPVQQGKPAYYICQNKTCKAPVYSLAALFS